MKRIAAMFLCVVLLAVCVVPAAAATAEEAELNTASTAKLFALTFDDGPGSYTARLLSGLASRPKAKVTFFFIGSNISSYKTNVANAYNQGHQVGSHTWSHYVLTSYSSSTVYNEEKWTENAIAAITGQTSFMMRCPYGSYNSTVLNALGAPAVNWSIDSRDWYWGYNYSYSAAVSYDYNAVVGSARDGSIALMHCTYMASVDSALQIIDALTSYGYEFVTLEELFWLRGITPTAGKMYTSAYPGTQSIVNWGWFRSSQGWEYFDSQGWRQYGWLVLDDGVYHLDETTGIMDTGRKQIDGEWYEFGTDGKLVISDELPFYDVSPNSWMYSAVKECYDQGITKGTSNYTFSPSASILRRDFVLMVWRQCGRPEPEGEASFTDIAGYAEEYQKAIAWAEEQSIVAGVGDGLFDPTGLLTREQAVTILCRRAAAAGADTSLYEETSLEAFSDAEKVSDWALTSVRWAVGCGLLLGSDVGLEPTRACTRAEMATLLVRYASLSEGNTA